MFKILNWRMAVPELASLSDEVSAILDDCTRSVTLTEGARLYDPDQPARSLYFLTSGRVRFQRRSSRDGVTTLSVVHAGDGNALADACYLSFGTHTTEALAETDVDAILLPRRSFDKLMRVSSAFRALVFDACAKRITDLSFVIEEAKARRIDVQLAEMLIELPEPANLPSARRRMSVELGSQPGVVSQFLAEFERRGWIVLERGSIEIADTSAMRELARQRVARNEILEEGALQ